jgi:hypothetical protein
MDRATSHHSVRLRVILGKQGLTVFESLYGRPFLTNDVLLDQEIAQLISHVIELAKFQQVLSEIRQGIPRENIQEHPLFYPRDLVLIKSPDPNQKLEKPPWEGSYPVILSTLTAV